MTNINTWPCGTPKSSNNAFTAHLVANEPIKDLTKAERDRARQREYFKARYVPAAERNAAVVAFKPGSTANFGALPETPASKAKTARLVGRRNSARSQ